MRWGLITPSVVGASIAVPPCAWAQINAAAFQQGAGRPPADLSYLIAAIIITIALLWVTWLSFGTVKAWVNGDLNSSEMMFTVLRGLLVLALLGFFIR